ncbi:MAG: hypothetical protein ACFFGZ_16485 [Candidatus Thorarchaeota archaeon]
MPPERAAGTPLGGFKRSGPSNPSVDFYRIIQISIHFSSTAANTSEKGTILMSILYFDNLSYSRNNALI